MKGCPRVALFLLASPRLTRKIRQDYLYGNGKLGLGIDMNAALAAKYPFGPVRNGSAYPLDRGMDGSVVKP